MDVRHMQRFLGHANLETTIYLHIVQSDMEGMIEQMDEVLP